MDYRVKYEQLTKFIKDLYPFMSDYCKEKTEGMIPELKESEDERIRKALCELVHDTTNDELWVNYNIHKEYAIAWLEKQGSQKPTEKFKFGDWIIRNADMGFKPNIYLVTEVKDYYVCEDVQGRRVTFTFNDVHKNFKLWNISDAKDGDVLATPYYILIFKEHLKDNGGLSYCHYDFGSGNPQFIWNEDNNWYFYKGAVIQPATKEQRDQLFSKMKEAGYEWDSEKKRLKKSDWVDLGLPSGTLWKSTNEANPNDNHDFYAYNDAVQKFGGNLPTKEQWEELKRTCEWTWKGTGYKVTSWNGYSIFLPAAGFCRLNGDVINVGSGGYYWSSTQYGSEEAWSLNFDSDKVYMNYFDWCSDQSVRLVKDGDKLD